jgi:hypothetical protein
MGHVVTRGSSVVRVAPLYASPSNDTAPKVVEKPRHLRLSGRQRLALSQPLRRTAAPFLAGRSATVIDGRCATTALAVEVGETGPRWHASVTLRDERGRLIPPRSLPHDVTRLAIAAALRLLDGVGHDDIEFVAGAASFHLVKRLTDAEVSLM